jgi:hypothetical protein
MVSREDAAAGFGSVLLDPTQLWHACNINPGHIEADYAYAQGAACMVGAVKSAASGIGLVTVRISLLGVAVSALIQAAVHLQIF